ncbi:MAG TPA: hypothetical protein VGH87_16215, partial [Polyangiaceae bacterium]
GFFLHLPGLLSPYWLDDFVHAAMVRGTYPSPRSPLDLYNFVNDGDRALLIDRGVLPWWTHPTLTIRFFRPLASVLRWAELKVFGDHPLIHHAHSFVWWALAVVVVHALYRKWLAPAPDRAGAALIATIVFALAPCHATPVAWLANREALMAIVFGALAIGRTRRFCEEGGARSFASAMGLYGLAMASGEYAFAFGGYALASSVLERGPRMRRATAFATFAVPAVAMLIVRHMLGCGNSGAGFYRDPFTQTGLFISGMPRRLALIVIDAWLGSESDWVINAAPWVVAAAIATLVVVVALPLRTTLAQQPDERRRVALVCIVGSLCAMVPMVGVVPSARLLGIVMLGTAPLVALMLERAWFVVGSATRTHDGRFGVFAVVLAFFHLVHGPVTTLLQSKLYYEASNAFIDRARSLADRCDGKPEQAKIVLARVSWEIVLFLPFALRADNRLPARWWVLSLAPHALMIRKSDRVVELLVPKGHGYFPTGPNDLFRNEDLPLHAGDEVTVPGLHATVLETGEHGPARVRFEFDQKLESLLWVADGYVGWHDIVPPQIGFGVPLDP